MDTTAQWSQGIGLINKPMEAISSRGSSVGLERRGTSSSSSTRAHNKDQILNCPRCNSINTKFCYYNNYSLSQPRYFCKTCRRYWTQGGSLRNVPVGGGSRKHNKRSSSTTKSTSTSTSSPTTSSQALSKMIMINNGGQDLNLAYHPAAPTLHDHGYDHHQNYVSTTTSNNINMISTSSRGLISSLIMPPPVVLGSDLNTLYPTGLMFPLQDIKPSLNFSLDHHYQHQQQHHGYGSSNLQQDQVQGGTSSTSARLLFPVNDLLKEKVQSSSTDFNEHKNIGQEERDSSTTGRYNWNNNNNNNSNNGMLSGGSWR